MMFGLEQMLNMKKVILLKLKSLKQNQLTNNIVKKETPLVKNGVFYYSPNDVLVWCGNFLLNFFVKIPDKTLAMFSSGPPMS